MALSSLLEKLGEKISDIKTLLEVRDQLMRDAHILIPTGLNARAGVVLYPTVITVNTTFRQYQSGRDTYTKTDNEDIYKTPNGGLYAFKEKKLREFKEALALQIFNDKLLDRKTDENGRVIYILFSLDYTFRSSNGGFISGTEIGKYDYNEEFAQANDEKDKEKKERLLNMVKQRRRYSDQHARTNALVRTINKAVPGLAPAYTLEDMKKPFIVAKAEIEILKLIQDQAPPEIRGELVNRYFDKLIGSVNNVYPDAPVNKQISAPAHQNLIEPAPERKQIEPAQVIEPEIGIDPAAGNDKAAQAVIEDGKVISVDIIEPDPERPPGMSDDEYAQYLTEQYKDVLPEQRVKKINELIERKGYVRKNGKAIEEYSAKKQMEFLLMLFKMADKKIQVQD